MTTANNKKLQKRRHPVKHLTNDEAATELLKLFGVSNFVEALNKYADAVNDGIAQKVESFQQQVAVFEQAANDYFLENKALREKIFDLETRSHNMASTIGQLNQLIAEQEKLLTVKAGKKKKGVKKRNLIEFYEGEYDETD